MRCFVSSPLDVPRSGVVDALQALDATAVTEYATQAGADDWASALRTTIAEVDCVVVILASEQPDPAALLLEIGVAIGLGRPVLVVVPKARTSRINLSGVQYAIADPEDSTMLQLHLKALIKSTTAERSDTEPSVQAPQPELGRWLKEELAAIAEAQDLDHRQL